MYIISLLLEAIGKQSAEEIVWSSVLDIGKLGLGEFGNMIIQFVSGRCGIQTHLCLIPEHMLILTNPNPLVPQDITVFGKKVFKEVIKFKEGH